MKRLEQYLVVSCCKHGTPPVCDLYEVCDEELILICNVNCQQNSLKFLDKIYKYIYNKYVIQKYAI